MASLPRPAVRPAEEGAVVAAFHSRKPGSDRAFGAGSGYAWNVFTPRPLKDERALRNEATAEARRAYRHGDSVFIFPLPSGKSSPGQTTWLAWQEIIQQIEAQGWRLEHWSVVGSGTDDCTAFPLFRRDDTPHGKS